MNDIGYVKFTINKHKSLLDIGWVYRVGKNEFIGSGFAEGEITDSFEGTYKVTYLNDKGEVMFSYDLEIISKDEYYLLNWFEDSKLLYSGVGRKENNILYAGWKKYQE